MDELEPHEQLIYDLKLLLLDAEAFKFHDFHTNGVAFPKATLVKRLEDLVNRVKIGKYDDAA